MRVSSSAGQHPKPWGNKISESRIESMSYWSLISEASASALPMRRIAAQLSLEKWNSKLKIINTLFHYISFNESAFLNVFVE